MKAFKINHADENTKSEAKQALIATLAISFLPLIIGFCSAGLDKGLAIAFRDIFLSGNLYFYAMSICAAIVVLVQLDNKTGNVGMRLWSSVFVLFCVGFMAFYIGKQNGDPSEILLHGVLSICFLFFAVWLNYRVLVLANSAPPPPEDVNRDRAEDLADDVEVDYDA